MAQIWRDKTHQFTDDAGAPLNAGTLDFYVTGTSTRKNAYSDEALATPIANPYTLNSNGRPAANIWISGRYKIVLKNSSGVQIGGDIDAAEDSVPASDFQDSSPTYGGNNSGTATALAFAYTPTLTALTNGAPLRGRITASSVGPFTVNPDGLGAKTLVDAAGNAITYLAGPNVLTFVYDSTTDVMRLMSGNNALMLGKHTIPVLAGSMFSRTTNGAAAGLTELATNDVMLATKDFDQTTSEGVQFYVPMPKSWNEGTVTAQFGWTASAGSAAETVIWSISARAFSDDDPLDTAFGSAQTATDALIATSDLHISPVTSAITVGGTPAESDFVIFQITRDISDTLAADAKLIWCKIFVTLTAGNDE